MPGASSPHTFSEYLSMTDHHVTTHLSRRFLATVGGRVNIDESGLAVYKRPAGSVGWTKLTPGGSLKHNLFNTGVTGSPQVRKGGKLMMITAISYLIIQAGYGAESSRYSHFSSLAFLQFTFGALRTRR